MSTVVANEEGAKGEVRVRVALPKEGVFKRPTIRATKGE